MRPEARAWWEESESELAAARDLLASRHYHLAAFFCQQAVEKAFKALWLHRREQMPPKTHNLWELGQGLGAPERFHSALRELNPLFATTRYPDAANGVPAEMFDERVARARLRDAEEIMAWCRDEIEKPPPDSSTAISEPERPTYRARPELAPFVHDFARRLHDEAGATKVILFGSRARGDALDESDYDFVVVSERFEGMHFVERPVKLYQYWEGHPGVELLCYTPEEFERKRQEISIVREAVREGIEL